MKKLGIQLGFALILFIMAIGITFAQTSNRPPIIPEGTEGQLIIPNTTAKPEDIPEEQYFGGVLLPILTKTVIQLAAGLAFLFMIVGGIQILTAYGSEEKVSAGFKTMTFAIVGLLISMLSFAIVSIISSVQIRDTSSSTSSEASSEK